MKALILADSHTDVDTMDLAVQSVKPDMVIHLGDHLVDALLLKKRHPGIRFEMVRGNTDGSNARPDEMVVQIGSVPALIAHGDLYHVENGPEDIAKAGKKAGARLVLHGHTHVPSVSEAEGLTVMNPGRIGRISSKSINASFGVVETDGDDFKCGVFYVDSIGIL